MNNSNLNILCICVNRLLKLSYIIETLIIQIENKLKFAFVCNWLDCNSININYFYLKTFFTYNNLKF